MKKFLYPAFCLFFVLITAQLSATHLITLDGYADCMGASGNEKEYVLNISSIRDAVASTVPFDEDLDVGIYGKSDGLLKKAVVIPKIRETVVYQTATGMDYMIEAYYSKSVLLPDLAGGYVVQFRRCCLPASINFIADQGMELLIFIPDNMQAGQHTLKRNSYLTPLVQKNKTYTFVYPWSHDLYDSIRFESKDYFIGGSDSDPLPGIPPTINYGQKGLFRNGASAGNPFGSSGTWTKNTDSSWQIQITQSGYFIYPVSTTCYLNGDSFKQTVLFPAISVDTVPPLLKLAFLSRSVERVLLATSVEHWTNIDSLVLQRHDPGMPQNQFVSIPNNLVTGISSQVEDISTNVLDSYSYRIKLVSAQQTNYSNVVFVLSGEVSIKNISLLPNNIQVFPNPAYSRIHVYSLTSVPYKIYSINGQLKNEGILEEGITPIHVEQLPAGIYFLKTEFETLKIVIDDRR